MKKKDYSNIGDDIKNIIQDALNSTEFNQLNNNISKTVNRALEEVKKGSHNWKQQMQNHNRSYENPSYEKPETAQENKKETSKIQNKDYTKQSIRNPFNKNKKVLVTKSPHGRISGPFLIVFGDIGIGLTLLFYIVLLFVSNIAFEGLSSLAFSSLALLPILLLSIFMVIKGTGLRRRVKRFYQYVNWLNGRTFCEIKELADPMGRSSKYVVKDLRKMIAVFMFPEGKIDEKETFLFISDESYKAYLKMEEQKRYLEEIEKDRIEIAQRQKMMDVQNPEMKAVREVITEGKDTIIKIREANEAIQGESISKKLERLEKVISKIFEHIKENPEELPEIRKFLGYYLPTTLKLVMVYQDLDGELIQGANIVATKKEIEETLDTINDAFENLLDSFYEDTAIDVSTDISVLNTMLAQEGLMKRDFENKGDTDNG